MFILPTKKFLLVDQKEGSLFDTNTNLLSNRLDILQNFEKEKDFLYTTIYEKDLIRTTISEKDLIRTAISERDSLNSFYKKITGKSASFSDFESFCNFVENKNITKQENKFNPYEDNSGTTIALKQDEYIIVAADTRLCSDMGIYSRNTTKIFLINNFCITVAGFYADGVELINRLKYEVLLYEAYNKMNIHSLANLISKVLYSRRFFPYYSYVSLSGFNDGKPYVYGFDCIGNFEELNCVCNGSGSSLAQPLLDSFIDKKNWHGDSPIVTENYALNVVRNAFDSAAERDVKTGDNLEIYVINEKNMRRIVERLRGD